MGYETVRIASYRINFRIQDSRRELSVAIFLRIALIALVMHPKTNHHLVGRHVAEADLAGGVGVEGVAGTVVEAGGAF